MVGPCVSDPVTVYSTVSRRADGELAHEGNRVPDIAVLDADRLVVGWRAGVKDSLDPTPNDQGSIGYARSADGGRTWVTGTLAEATDTHRYHYVIFLNDSGVLYALLGRITIAEDRDQAGNVDGFPVRMVAKRSADAGATWHDFPITVDVPPNSRGVVVAGKPIRYDGVWLLPYWRQTSGGTRAGVLRSTDLRTWRPGGSAQPPPGIGVEEPQVAPSQEGGLVMVARALDLRGGTSPEDRDARYRAHAAYAAVSTSTDGGLTWAPMTLDPQIPNYYVKGFFARDGEGRYLTIYNTLAGPFRGDKPEQYREVLHYKVKPQGLPWGPGRLFADGTRLTAGAARGWDVYAGAEEYEPGRFFVVWEHNQIGIRVARLDLTRAFTGVRLAGPGSVPQAPDAGFVATVEGEDFRLTVGGRLDLTVGAEGVLVDGRRVLGPGGARWRVVADRRGRAALWREDADTGVRWTLGTPETSATQGTPPSGQGPRETTLSGQATAEVTDNLAGLSWADWKLSTSTVTGDRLRLRGSASVPLEIAESCDFTVELRGRVVTAATLDPVTGRGVSLGTKVANGARRLMMTVQRDEVWAMTKGSTRWRRVHRGSAGLWRVAVDSAGVARLFADGADTGASWVVQDNRERPHAAHWVSGGAEALLDWTLVTATLG